MEHVELKCYWLYKYRWGDGLTFETNQKLTDLEMIIGDCAFERAIQIHYTEEITGLHLMKQWRWSKDWATRSQRPKEGKRSGRHIQSMRISWGPPTCLN